MQWSGARRLLPLERGNTGDSHVPGFLNANPAPGVVARVANYGLMDQLAALHWLQQNAALFGGDPGRVTLMGHGSGAACIEFLMVSPTSTPGQ